MGKSDYKAEALEYKYADIPEENKSKKKKKKAAPKKVKHKHVYVNGLVEMEEGFFSHSPLAEENSYCFVSYCSECGKLGGKYVEDEFTDKFIPRRSIFTFGYIPCPLMGSVGNYNEFIREAKKTYRVFHQKSFNLFEQKYLGI